MSLKDDGEPELLSIKDKIKKFQGEENVMTGLKPTKENSPSTIRSPSPRNVNIQSKDRRSNCNNSGESSVNRETTEDTPFDDSSDFIDIQQIRQCEFSSSDIRLEADRETETTYGKHVPEETFLQRNENSITNVSSRTGDRKTETTYEKHVPEQTFLQRNENSITTVPSRTGDFKTETTYEKHVPEETFLQRNENSITNVSSRTGEINMNNLFKTLEDCSSKQSTLYNSITEEKMFYPNNTMDSGYPSQIFSPMPNPPPPIGFEAIEQQPYYPLDSAPMPMPMPSFQHHPSPYSPVHPPKQMSVDSYFGGGNPTYSGRSPREMCQQPSLDSYFHGGNPTHSGRSTREMGQQPQKFSNFEIPIETSNDQQKSKSLKVTVQVEMSENT